MQIHHQPNRKGGTTLVELLVSIGILSLAVVGLLQGIGSCLSQIRSARETQRATQILLEKMETIRLYSWTQVTKPNFIPEEFTEYYDDSDYTGLKYNGKVKLEDGPNTDYKADMRTLTLTLTWESEKRTHTATATTLIAKDGIQNYVY